MGGPLLAGVTVVALSSLAPMALPLGMRGLAIAESISLYGGLAVFGGFVLYEWAFSLLCASISVPNFLTQVLKRFCNMLVWWKWVLFPGTP